MVKELGDEMIGKVNVLKIRVEFIDFFVRVVFVSWVCVFV